jgi:hypothetical protein
MSKKRLKNITHLVTSGCSFSDNCVNDADVVPGRWPHFVAKHINAKLDNRGQGSCGNDWISKSVIYETQKLLDDGICPQNILVMVMWSGIDRKGTFISRQETSNFKQLLNIRSQSNPVNFIDSTANENCPIADTSGYLVGSLSCNFENNNINVLKKEILKNITNEELAIESYEHFLRVQWFCKSNNIKLINLTFMDIMHYPKYSTGPLTGNFYENVKHLYKMIDFSNWIFWNQTGGIYEYTKDMKLALYPDGSHPTAASHLHYVDCFLIPKLKTLSIL